MLFHRKKKHSLGEEAELFRKRQAKAKKKEQKKIAKAERKASKGHRRIKSQGLVEVPRLQLPATHNGTIDYHVRNFAASSPSSPPSSSTYSSFSSPHSSSPSPPASPASSSSVSPYGTLRHSMSDKTLSWDDHPPVAVAEPGVYPAPPLPRQTATYGGRGLETRHRRTGSGYSKEINMTQRQLLLEARKKILSTLSEQERQKIDEELEASPRNKITTSAENVPTRRLGRSSSSDLTDGGASTSASMEGNLMMAPLSAVHRPRSARRCAESSPLHSSAGAQLKVSPRGDHKLKKKGRDYDKAKGISPRRPPMSAKEEEQHQQGQHGESDSSSDSSEGEESAGEEKEFVFMDWSNVKPQVDLTGCQANSALGKYLILRWQQRQECKKE